MSDAEASGYLDPESFPFTEAEVRQALLLMSSEAEATRAAAEIAADAAHAAEFSRAAEEARARGSQDPDELASPSWGVSTDLLALLRCVPDVAARVDALMERMWADWTRSWTRSEMRLRGLPADDDPPAEVIRAVRRRLAPYRGAWTRRKRRVADLLK